MQRQIEDQETIKYMEIQIDNKEKEKEKLLKDNLLLIKINE